MSALARPGFRLGDERPGSANGLPQPQSRRPAVLPEVAIRDWSDLLGAVKARLQRIDGDLRPAEPEFEPLGQAEVVRAAASVLECVAALDQLQATLTHEFARRQARNHALVALADRTVLRRHGASVMATAESGAIVHLDLDDFRAVNQAHGRDVGDAVLGIVATRLAHAIRADDLVNRIGGDEFVILLGGLPSGDHLSHLACKLFDAVSAPLTIGALRLTVRPSLGVAALPHDGGSLDELLTNARAAMRRAKRSHCGYAFFDRLADG